MRKTLGTLMLLLTVMIAASCSSEPLTPFERYSTGKCVDIYIAYEASDMGPYCPHPDHIIIDEWLRVDVDTGVTVRTFACACL